MGTSLARAVVSRGPIRAAEETGAEPIAHGATGKANDQLRFELSACVLKPDIKVTAPWREWDMKDRANLEADAKRLGIPVPTSPDMPYSMDMNLLHISYEGGALKDLQATHPLRVPEDHDLLDPRGSVEARRSPMGGSFVSVAEQIEELRTLLPQIASRPTARRCRGRGAVSDGRDRRSPQSVRSEFWGSQWRSIGPWN